MRKRNMFPKNTLLVMTGLLLLGSARDVSAQNPVVPSVDSVVQIRKMPRLGRSLLVRTPEYQNNVARPGVTRKSRDWAFIEIEYRTSAEWVDELTFAYHVLTQNKERQFSLHQLSVTYVDIERGDHVAAVVLPPAAVERHGDVVALGVEISMGPELQTRKSAASINLPEAWWNDPRVLENPNIPVARRTGYLKDRSNTPFAMANIDDYEAVK